MLKRIGSAGFLTAAVLLAAVTMPARATEDTASNYQIARTRDLPTFPGERLEPIATPTPGDDDMPNRTVRRSATIPHTSTVSQDDGSRPVYRAWYLAVWERVRIFGMKVVYFMKA